MAALLTNGSIGKKALSEISLTANENALLDLVKGQRWIVPTTAGDDLEFGEGSSLLGHFGKVKGKVPAAESKAFYNLLKKLAKEGVLPSTFGRFVAPPEGAAHDIYTLSINDALALGIDLSRYGLEKPEEMKRLGETRLQTARRGLAVVEGLPWEAATAADEALGYQKVVVHDSAAYETAARFLEDAHHAGFVKQPPQGVLKPIGDESLFGAVTWPPYDTPSLLLSGKSPEKPLEDWKPTGVLFVHPQDRERLSDYVRQLERTESLISKQPGRGKSPG